MTGKQGLQQLREWHDYYAGRQLFRTLDQPGALRLVGFATLFLLISATATSWDLLVRVAEIRQAMTK